jgi:hypothetical protein
MSLFDWFQPKWKHRDAAIREHAVLGLKRQDVLEAIANDDPSEQIRLAAVARLTDQRTLARFACRNDALALAAMKLLTDRKLIADVGLRSASREVRELAVDSLDDRVVLHRIANSDTNPRVRWKARKKHAGRDALREVIQTELAQLQLAHPRLEKKPEFCGTLDEVSRALVNDGRLRLSGSLEANLPGQAVVRELGHEAPAAPAAGTDAESTAPAARFLALTRTEDGAATRTYYEIAVWRTGENTFHGYTEERHLDMIVNPVMWSSISNGATAGSARNKTAPAKSSVTVTANTSDPA